MKTLCTRTLAAIGAFMVLATAPAQTDKGPTLESAIHSLESGPDSATAHRNAMVLESAIRSARPGDKLLSQAFYLLARAFQDQNNTPDAILSYESALQTESNRRRKAMFGHTLMQLYAAAGRKTEAISMSDNVEQLALSSPATTTLAKSAILSRAQYQEESPKTLKSAAATYEHYLKLSKKLGGPWKEYDSFALKAEASVMLRVGQDEEANRLFKKWLTTNEHDLEAPYISLQLARSQSADGLPSPATLSRLLKEYPEPSGGRQILLYEYGVSLYQSGQSEKALEPLKEAFEYAPAGSRPDPLYSKGINCSAGILRSKILRSLNRAEEALESATTMAVRYKGRPEMTEVEQLLLDNRPEVDKLRRSNQLRITTYIGGAILAVVTFLLTMKLGKRNGNP